MGGKGEFVSITKLKEATQEERDQLQARIINIIGQATAEIAVIAIDPNLHSGFRVILEPKNREPPKKG